MPQLSLPVRVQSSLLHRLACGSTPQRNPGSGFARPPAVWLAGGLFLGVTGAHAATVGAAAAGRQPLCRAASTGRLMAIRTAPKGGI